MPFFRAVPENCLVCELDLPELGGWPATVINDLQSTRAVDLLFQLGRFQAGKFRNRLHVDIEGIEKESAVRCVGAGISCPVLEQRVQRVEPDPRGAEIGSKVDERGEIGKVAVSPIPQRPDPVKLHRERPHPRQRSLPTLIGAIAANDQADILAAIIAWAGDCDTQLEYAILQDWQRQQGRCALALANFSVGDDLPAQRLSVDAGQTRGLIDIPAHDDRARQRAISGVGGSKRVEDSSKNLRLDGAQVSETVLVLGLHTATSRAFEDAGHATLYSDRPIPDPDAEGHSVLRRASDMIRVCSVDTGAVASHDFMFFG